MCSGRIMSASPNTSMTGMESFFTSSDQSTGRRINSPIRSSSLGKSFGLGATATYDLYIGVPFICSAMAEPGLLRQHLREEAVLREGRRDDREAAYEGWMLDREPKAGSAAEGVAGH